MKLLSKILIFIFILIDALLVFKILLVGKTVAVLNPKGWVALQERDLMFLTLFFMFLVVIPVFIFAFHVLTSYHEENKKSRYEPEWDHSTKLQIFLWGFPTTIILILCVINWIGAHKLDPRNALASGTKPLTVQVVALRWKWLFIYPEQGIATVNYLAIPQKTPINFEITALDTPMNSFWIPQLGGQIYAMAGMATQTHMIADGIGTYRGSNAEINGAGFAGMTFTAQSMTRSDFDGWVTKVKQSPYVLTKITFNTLSQPTEDNPIAYYSSTEENLYNTIVMRYMAPRIVKPDESQSSNTMSKMPGM